MSFGDQRAAELLAICNDIGEAAYLDSQVAAQLLEIIRRLPCKDSVLQRLASRYGFGFQDDMSSELILEAYSLRSTNFTDTELCPCKALFLPMHLLEVLFHLQAMPLHLQGRKSPCILLARILMTCEWQARTMSRG